METKPCLHCHEPIVLKGRRPDVKFCSNRCRTAWHNLRRTRQLHAATIRELNPETRMWALALYASARQTVITTVAEHLQCSRDEAKALETESRDWVMEKV